MYKGLSLSLCVKDIASNLISYDEVEQIVAATNATTDEVWSRVFSTYAQASWCAQPEQCIQIARRLIAEGKIDQPRTRGEDYLAPDDHHWLRDGQPYRVSRQTRL